MPVQPYVSFEGRCEEALAFYSKAIGAKVADVMRVKDAPPMPGDASPGDGCMAQLPPDKILHASFTVGDSMVMASDGMCSGKPVFQGISLALSAPTEAEARRLFDALAEGGQVQMPIGGTFFSPAFGMLADRFGVSWMVVTVPPGQCG